MTTSPSTDSGLPQEEHDIYTDPALKEKISEGPIEKFILSHWKQLVLIAAAVAAGFFITNKFEESYQKSMGASAATFRSVQSGLTEIRQLKRQASLNPDTDEKALAERTEAAAGKLRAALTALGDAKEPYKTLSRIYEGLLVYEEGNAQRAIELLQGVAQNWTTQESGSAERLYQEVAALALAKILLLDSDRRVEGIALLEALSKDSDTAQAPAALALAYNAKNNEEIARASGIIGAVIERYPELTDALQPEYNRLQGLQNLDSVAADTK